MLRELHAELGIPADYGAAGGPPVFEEAVELVEVGPNLVGRMQRLTPEAATQWTGMVAAADQVGIQLLIVSGFRGIDYQAGLIRKKIEAGTYRILTGEFNVGRIRSSLSDRLDRRFDGAKGRDHDDVRCQGSGLQIADQIEAVQIGHSQVGNDKVNGLAAHRFQTGFSTVCR